MGVFFVLIKFLSLTKNDKNATKKNVIFMLV